MIDWLIDLDRALFLFFNTEFTHPIFDAMMPFLRHRNTWIPLYIIIIFVAVYKKKWQVLPWLIGIIIAVAGADIISSHFFKPYFGRLRPCNELSPVYEQMILRLKKCSGHNSFTSSHAANHGAIAAFMLFSTSYKYRKYMYVFIPWALIICWAQMYVGVHYPLDILGGLIIGCFTAWIGTQAYKLLMKKYFIKNG